MFAGVRTVDLDFGDPDWHPFRYFDPGIAGRLKRIDRIRDHCSTESEVISGNCVSYAISRIVEGLTSHSGGPNGLFDRIDS
jgi:hypothetical protein